ncbi:hypothetical protein N7466_002856 [Penicillium verhagenii]|uniref:uncharacterized protein n=1 Tax=Penicillium verhagenii TaxID=1562060 RepID=UPI002544E9F1|nr:uncharacterized protein N7466_002856 [Penicillium verhagenii]KAJ5939722.1 hypothetical protein N7466_002856 [Penicillium verhagenii]
MAMPIHGSQSIYGTYLNRLSSTTERYESIKSDPAIYIVLTKGQTILALAVLYLPTLALAKLAVLSLYYRVLESVRMWRYTLWTIGAGWVEFLSS